MFFHVLKIEIRAAAEDSECRNENQRVPQSEKPAR